MIGYPDWWGDRPKGEGKIGWKDKSQSRGGAGRGRGASVRANATRVEMYGGAFASITDVDKAGLTGLTTDQWQRFVDILNKPKINEKMTGKIRSASWIIDIGASNHLTGNLNEIREVCDIVACLVGLPDGKRTNATNEGTVLLEGGLKLTNVLYVPKLSCSLIYVSQLLDESNCTVQFTNKLCVMQDLTSRMLIGAGEHKDGLYYFRGIRVVKAYKTDGVNQIELWHRCLGHLSFKITQSILDISKNKCEELSNKNCDICLRAKKPREQFSVSEHKANGIFELIHCDLWGPYKNPSSCGAFYFMTIVDDYSRGVWIYLLTDKKEVPRMLMNFSALIKRQFDKHVKIFRSDNGIEFLGMKNYFFEQGIIFQTSCVGTPQQNERVERKHRHILNIARALRFQGNLPIEFWGECVLATGYLINRTPSMVLDGKMPYEMLHGQPPSLKHLRTFGCLSYAHNQGRKGDKFASKSRRCIFVGYPHGKKGWKLFDLDKKEYFVSRDVVFVENEYPFNKLSNCVHDDISSHSHGREVNVPNCVGDCARIDQELSGADDRGHRRSKKSTGRKLFPLKELTR